LWLRHYLTKRSGVKIEDCVLDLCTGTGSMAIVLTQYVPQGMVVGVDFSLGMLRKAREKAKGTKNLYLWWLTHQLFPLKLKLSTLLPVLMLCMNYRERHDSLPWRILTGA